MDVVRRLSLVQGAHKFCEEALTSIHAADGVYSTFVRAGQDAPMFSATDSKGQLKYLSGWLSDGAVVLSFQRGDWCAYCTASMDTLIDVYDRIREAGANLVFVFPCTPTQSLRQSNKGERATVLIDASMLISRLFGVAYLVPEQLRERYLACGYKPPETPDESKWQISAPATYVIDQFGCIVLAYLDLDYRTPMNPSCLLSVLRNL